MKKNLSASKSENRWKTICVFGCFHLAILSYALYVKIPAPDLLSPIPAYASENLVRIYPVDRIVEVTNPTIENIVNFYAKKYDVSAKDMLCTLKHESGYRKYAQNGQSTATGIAQILIGTWKGWRKEMHEDQNPNLRFDADESIKTMAWAFSKGKQNAWEAYKTHCR